MSLERGCPRFRTPTIGDFPVVPLAYYDIAIWYPYGIHMYMYTGVCTVHVYMCMYIYAYVCTVHVCMCMYMYAYVIIVKCIRSCVCFVHSELIYGHGNEYDFPLWNLGPHLNSRMGGQKCWRCVYTDEVD